MEERAKRKLTAILSADVKGYSRLMGEDDVATIRTLEEYRELMSNLINQHRGRVVDSPGDNLLAEFASVVDAVESAVEIQKELKTKNAELPETRRMEFRIGINLGDVVEEGERIYGDGVNIAARIEGLADGGGISISRKAFQEVKNKLSLGYEYQGKHTVKNIAEPVRVYRVLLDPAYAGKVIGEEVPKTKNWRWATIAMALIIIAGVLALWSFYFRSPSIEQASIDRMAFPLPDKPSIAVLPFDNMSGDTKQEYLADGITENIISALSTVPKIFVIARNSTFTFKGKPVKVQHVAEELGVRYVLEGSVQKSGKSLRITAQLIDAINGHHLWSERYDRKLKDMFALQDEITLKIIGAIQVKLTEGEQAHLRTKKTENLQAYLKYLQARDHINSVTKEGNTVGRQILKEVIALDPKFSPAYLALGATYWLDILLGSSRSPEESLKRAFKLTKKALALDDSDGSAHTLLGYLYTRIGQYDKAITECEQGIDLSPNSDFAHLYMGLVLSMAGKREDAVRFCEQAIRLSPIPPGYYFRVLAGRYLLTGRFEEAIITSRKALDRAPNDLLAHLVLAAAYVQTGHEDEARTEVTEALKINPKFSLKYFAKSLMYKNKADKEFVLNALRKAGLPETPPLPLPDKSSIAVLPFVNMSGDPEQEYFSDGITEDLITDLSKISELFVISRNSVFRYKGKAVEAKKVGQELGVKYLLEGSVRKAGDQIRITAQLIDPSTGGHIWAERYDGKGKMADTFTLQDNIRGQIVKALAVQLTPGEQERLARKDTKNIAAYDAFLKGWRHFLRVTPADLLEAARYFKEAIELDPNYGKAYAALARTYMAGHLHGFDKKMGLQFVGGLVARANHYLRKAMKNPTFIAYQVAAELYFKKYEYEAAIAEAERAIALDPNDPSGQKIMGMILTWSGRANEALGFFKTAMRLDPLNPARYLLGLGEAHFCMGQLEQAATYFERALKYNPELYSMAVLATYAYLGRDQEVRALVENYKKGLLRDDYFNLRGQMSTLPIKDSIVAERLANGLLKAGIPGEPGGYYRINKENKMRGEEIRELFFGRAHAGFFLGSNLIQIIDIKEDGNATYTIGRLSDRGNAWIEEDMLCLQWEMMLDGYGISGYFYRNPNGKPETRDEFLYVSELYIGPRSLFE